MISLLRSLGRKSLALPAVLIVCLLPATAHAEKITITNTTSSPVIVQIIIPVGPRGVPQRLPAISLAAGASTPALSVPGNKFVEISDPTAPAVPLLRQGIPPAKQDQFWDITAGKGAKAQTQLVQGMPPKAAAP